MSDMYHTCNDCNKPVQEAGSPYCDDCMMLRDAYQALSEAVQNSKDSSVYSVWTEEYYS